MFKKVVVVQTNKEHMMWVVCEKSLDKKRMSSAVLVIVTTTFYQNTADINGNISE